MSYGKVSDHRSMALDLRRNQAYLEALRQVITPDSIVLDLGAGLGVLGLMAAKLGAKMVYLVEIEDVLSVAEEIARSNDLATRVKCILGRADEIDIPEKVDVILSVFTGNLLVIEDLLPTLFVARERFLKPGGALIPQGGILRVAPVSELTEFEDNVAIWSKPHLDLDFDPVRHYAANSLVFPHDKLKDAIPLAEPQVALELDFHRADSTACDAELTFTITQSGECHGIAGWPELDLGGDWFSTAPDQPATHWRPALLPVDPPIQLTRGDELRLSLGRPQKGDWTWSVEAGGSKQTHSTFYSRALTPSGLAKLSAAGTPRLSERGLAARRVLSLLDGSVTLGRISEDLAKEYPGLFADPSDAFSFVQHLAREYA